MCVASIVFILLLTKIRLETVISAFLLSFGISYVLYYVAAFVIGSAFTPFIGREGAITDYNKPVYSLIYAIAVVLQLLLSHFLFRIRRFRKGFLLLHKRYAITMALIFSGGILVIATQINEAATSEKRIFVPLFLLGTLIIGIGVYIWIRRGISMFQWQKTMLRNVELLEEALAAEKEKNRRLDEKIEILQTANHKFIRRLEAMEYRVARQGTEFREELAVSIEDVKKLQKEHQAEVSRVKGKILLPSVKIKELDNMFELFAEKFAEAEIDFNLKVNGSILYMTENIIPQGKLEMMVGDHLQDALIAINAGENTYRAVLAGIGLAGSCYEFSVSDSGIPFYVDTLTRLGTERVTTHADGSGIGFMTTFETMRECGASLIIIEKPPSATDYTKTVTIRFDGENRYSIKTYRPGEFPPSDRYTVE